MIYACLRCTHFTHATKLYVDGGRTLLNDPNGVRLVYPEDNKEGRAIMKCGVLCQIYGQDLVADTAALNAVMLLDNKNADVQLAEDEMAVYGRVHSIIVKLKADNTGKDPALADVLREVKDHGLGTLNEQQLMDLITFRSMLSDKVSGAFMAMQFNCVGGLVRVTTTDYASLTHIDHRAQWVKVCILVYQYLQTKKLHP
jgi:hypothetical protein